MAKPQLLTHPKFRRLVHKLGIPEPHALGHLEMLWHVAYETGNPRIGDATDVELGAKWTGEPGALCAAMRATGFLDDDDDGAFRIHDLTDHAPKYVKDRLYKRLKGRTNSEKVGDKKRNGEPKRSRRSNLSKKVGVSQPSPAQPLPIPNPEQTPGIRPVVPHQRFIDTFCTRWESRYGKKYPFDGGRDGFNVKHFCEVLKGDHDEWCKVLDRYFANGEKFFEGHDISHLRHSFPKFYGGAATKKPHQGVNEWLAATGGNDDPA